MSNQLFSALNEDMLSQMSDFLCLGDYCEGCLKEHLACPSVNEIIAGIRFYDSHDDNDVEDENEMQTAFEEQPPSYEEAMTATEQLRIN